MKVYGIFPSKDCLICDSTVKTDFLKKQQDYFITIEEPINVDMHRSVTRENINDSDILFFAAYYTNPLFRKTAYELFRDHVPTSSQWIQTEFEDTECYLLNILEPLNAVVQSKSKLDFYEDDRSLAWRIDTLCFDPDVVEDQILFRDHLTLHSLYGTQRTIELVEKHKLTGFEFRLLWDSEHEPFSTDVSPNEALVRPEIYGPDGILPNHESNLKKPEVPKPDLTHFDLFLYTGKHDCLASFFRFEPPNELMQLYQGIGDKPINVHLDFRKYSSHHFFEEPFHLLVPGRSSTGELTPIERPTGNESRFELENKLSRDHFYYQNRILRSGADESLKRGEKTWNHKQLLVFGWRHYREEEYLILTYLFDENGRKEGIYCIHFEAYNTLKKVAFSLSDAFLINDDTLDKLNAIKDVKQPYLLPSLYTKSREIKLLNSLKATPKIIDSESVDGVRDYDYLLDMCEQLSEGNFVATNRQYSEENSKRTVSFTQGKSNIEMTLKGDTDYIDFAFFDYVNQALESSGKRQKKFLAYWSESLGQDVRVIFASKKDIETIRKITSYEIL